MPVNQFGIETDTAEANVSSLPSSAVSAAPKKYTSTFAPDNSSSIIDVATGKRVRVSENEISDLIADNKVRYANQHKVSMVDPDGARWDIDGEHVKYALSQGYKIESAKEQAAADFAKKHNTLNDKALVALGQFADEALMGIPEAIFDKYGNEYDVAKKDALKKQNQLINDVAGVGGFAASMALGGELTGANKAGAAVERAILGAGEKQLAANLTAAGVKGAEKLAPSLIKETIAKAAGMGVENVVLNSPVNITEAMLGDPEKAGEHALINFGLGFGLGAAGAVGKRALGKIGGELGSAESNATNSLFYSRNVKLQAKVNSLPGGEEALGRRLLDDGLIRDVGEDFESLSNRIAKQKEVTGQAIGDLYKELDAKVANVKFNSSKLASADELAARARTQIIDELKSLPGNEAKISKVNAYLDSLEQVGKNKNLTFSELHKWRASLDDKIYSEGAIGITDPVKQELKKVRDIFTDELERTGEKVAREQGSTFVDRLNDLNTKYKQYKIASDIAKKSSEVERQNRAFSPSDYGVGIGSGIMSAVSGSPIPAVAGIVKSMGHKFVRENGRGLLAKAMDRVGFNSKGASLLKYGIENGGDNAGLIMMEKALKDDAKKLDAIPSILKSLSIKNVARRAIVPGISRGVSDMVLAQKTAELVANPDQLNADIEAMSSIIKDQGAPEIGRAYAAKQKTALEYLQREAPKVAPMDPFKMKQPEVSKPELAKYSRKVEVVENPYSVLDHIKNGTLTSEHVEALSVVYPKIAQEMLNRINDHAFSGKMEPLAYRARKSIDLYKQVIEKNSVQSPAFKQVVKQDSVWQNYSKPKSFSPGSIKGTAGLTMSDMDRVVNKGVGSK